MMKKRRKSGRAEEMNSGKNNPVYNKQQVQDRFKDSVQTFD